jgi:hypothetical protein
LVPDLETASAMYSAARDKSGLGASKFREGRIVDVNGNPVARISYNGRVWPVEDWHVGQKPLVEAA